MSIESSLVTLLKAICPRVYTDFAPVLTQRPYVTFQGIGGEVINTLENSVPNKRNAVIQVNVWADTRVSANTVIQQIEDAIRTSSSFIGRPQSAPINDFDADIPVYRAMQDFSIWGDR